MKSSIYRFALWSALLASFVFLLILMLRNAFNWYIFVACGVVLITTGLLLGDRRNVRPRLSRGNVPITTDYQLSFLALLSGFPDPVVLLDTRGLVTHLNAGARALFPSLVEGRPLAIFVRAPAILDGIERVLNGEGSIKAEFREHGAVERTLQAHIAPLMTSGHMKPGAVMLVIRDLTSARRLERMRVDFVANASHELRTPLASLIGFIDTLQGAARNDADARERFLITMREQAKRMSRLIDDLLSLSRIEMHLHLAPNGIVEMQAIIRHIIETLSPLVQKRKMSISLEEAEEPLFVNGDRDELLQVVQNLIENAIKYGHSGQKVEVSVQSSPSVEQENQEDVVMDVRDFGPGISPEHLPRLTERFYRADVNDSREKGGTGLGLAIVKHIVNRHRGRLEIISTFGEGATFRVFLPRVNSSLTVLSGDPVNVLQTE